MLKAAKITLTALLCAGFILPAQMAFAQPAEPGLADRLVENLARENGVAVPNLDQPQQGDDACSWLGLATNMRKCLLDSVLANVSHLSLEIFSYLLSLAGLLLNLSLYYTVVQMSEILNQASSINTAWAAIRDLGNLTFIFVLLYAAIGTILQQGINTRRMIKNVVVVALLINFSMFFTKVAIDASNLFTLEIYGALGRMGGFQFEDYNNNQKGLSIVLADALALGKIYGRENGVQLRDQGSDVILMVGIMGSILMLGAALILFIMAIMFVVRFVILIILLILSPLAFMGMAVPFGRFNTYGNQWLNTLTSQLLFAPVFMILMWIVLVVLNSTNGLSIENLNGSASAGSLASGGLGASEVLFRYVIAGGFLVATLVISKQVATSAGGQAASAMHSGIRWGGAAVFGGGGLAARYTAGIAGQRWVEGERAQRWAAKSKVGRVFYGTAKKASQSSFDARNTKPLSRLTGVLDTDLGKGGGQGGYEKSAKERKKRWEAFTHKKELGEIKKKVEAWDSIDSGITAQKEIDDLNKILDRGDALTDDQKERQAKAFETINRARRALQQMNDQQLESLGPKIENAFVAQNLSPQRFASLQKSEKVKQDRKEKINTARYGWLDDYMTKHDDTAAKIKELEAKEAAKTASEAEIKELKEKKAWMKRNQENIGKISVQDMEYLDTTYVAKTHFAAHLSQGTVDTATKADNSTLSNEFKKVLSDTRFKPTLDALTKEGNPDYSPVKAREAMRKIKGDVAGKLNIEILKNPDILESYEKDKLTEMAKVMSEGDRKQLKDAIMATIPSDETPPGTPPVLGPDGRPVERPKVELTNRQKAIKEYFEKGAGAELY